jgi:hypothetical protein
MVDGIISKDIPLHSASIHKQGRVGSVDLDETGLAALRMEWRQGNDSLAEFVMFSDDLVDAMSAEEFANLYYDAALRQLKKGYAA